MTNEDGHPPEDEAFDPYDPRHGHWPTTVRRKCRKRSLRRQPVHVDVPAGVVIILANAAGENDGPE